jgi:hypothetical protein
MSHQTLQQGNVNTRLVGQGFGADASLAGIPQVLEDFAVDSKPTVCRPGGLAEISAEGSFD